MSTFASFPQTEVGLPKEVQYVLPASLDESARSYTVHQSPNGVQTITGASLTSNAFVANSGGYQSQAFASQQIGFDVPCGMSPSVFLDPAETTISFRLTWVVTTASSATAPSMRLIGSASSFIDSLQLVSNNTPIETINGYGQLFNMTLNTLVNFAERYGGITALGCDVDAPQGIELAHASTGTYYYNFTIPLMCLLGQSTYDKWIPIGMMQNIQLLLNTSNTLPVATYCTAVTTQPVISAPVLDQFVLNMKYVDLGPSAGSAIMNSARGGKLYLKSQTYTNSNVAIPTGSAGAVQSLLQIRNSSVKSLLFYNSIDKSAACPNGYYDAVNPASTKTQLVIAGNRFPNKEMNPSLRPAEAMMYYLNSWGQKGDLAHLGGCLNRNYYGATIPSAPSGSDYSIVVPASGLRTYSNQSLASDIITSFPNMHYLGIDLERCGGVLFNGISTRQNPPYVEQNLAVTSTSAITLQAWSISDVILEVDVASKQVIAYI